jgi:hypothetical protein
MILMVWGGCGVFHVPDMRNRVDILYNHAAMHKQSTDCFVAASGGGVGSIQLTATLLS